MNRLLAKAFSLEWQPARPTRELEDDERRPGDRRRRETFTTSSPRRTVGINTPNKRASAIGIAFAVRLVLPVPDDSISTRDRQHVAYCYAGISTLINVLKLCTTSVHSLVTRRAVKSLNPLRMVGTLNPFRLVKKRCDP